MGIRTLSLAQHLKAELPQTYVTPLIFNNFTAWKTFKKHLRSLELAPYGKLVLQVNDHVFAFNGYIVYHQINGEQRMPTLWIDSDTKTDFKKTIGMIESFFDQFGFTNDWQNEFLVGYQLGLTGEQVGRLDTAWFQNHAANALVVKHLNSLLYQVTYVKLMTPLHQDALRNQLIIFDQALWK